MNLLDQAGMTGSCEGLATSPTGAKLAVWARDRKPRRVSGLRGDVNRPTPYLMMMRSYSPILGRFVSADPLLESNRYSYVNNNPIAFVDPLGLVPSLIADTNYYMIGNAKSGRKKQENDAAKMEARHEVMKSDSVFTFGDPRLKSAMLMAIERDAGFATTVNGLSDLATAQGAIVKYDFKDEGPEGLGQTFPTSGGRVIQVYIGSNSDAVDVNNEVDVALAIVHETTHALQIAMNGFQRGTKEQEKRWDQRAYAAMQRTASLFREEGLANTQGTELARIVNYLLANRADPKRVRELVDNLYKRME